MSDPTFMPDPFDDPSETYLEHESPLGDELAATENKVKHPIAYDDETGGVLFDTQAIIDASEADREDKDPDYQIVNESSLRTFLAAFQTRGRYHLGDLNLDEEYLETFLSNFALRIDGILQKYRQGQLEHGGDIRDRDLGRERSQEIDDLVVYDVVENTCKGLRVTVRV